MNTKTIEAQARFKALGREAGQGTFEAVVAVYDNVDRQGDRIKAGAFDETLAGWRASGDPIPVVLAHRWDDAWSLIGHVDPHDVLSVPGKGLVVRNAKLDIDTNPLAAQVYRLMERRLLKEFSFGYRIPDGGEQRAADGAFDLVKLELIELGPCLKGANPATELVGVKTDGLDELAATEALIRREVKALDGLAKASDERELYEQRIAIAKADL